MSQNSNLLKNTIDLLETDPEIKSYIYQQIHDFTPFITPETLIMVIARDPKAIYSPALKQQYATDDATESGPTDKIGGSITESINLTEDADDTDSAVNYELEEQEAVAANYKYRIAIILKEGDSAIEAEAFHNDVFEAIRLAKEKLVERLVSIRDEIESPQDRIRAIKDASDNSQVH